MREKIEKLKSSMGSVNDSHELAAALGKLDETLCDKPPYPGDSLIGEAIDETVNDLGNPGSGEGILSKRWASLAEKLEEWEHDHPRITLVIGDFARALAIAGL